MKQNKRHLLQALAALAQNAHLSGFFAGKIYKGPGKHLCVPGLNCYSCPGALGACPIGSIQAAIGGQGRSFPCYVVGFLLLVGVLVGRLVCAFLCPFGFLQDLLHKIPTRKFTLPRRLDKLLRLGKYVALAAVFLLPALLTDAFGLGAPYFCKYVCPAGTLEAGIPLLLGNASLRGAVGFLFSWKMAVLIGVLLASVFLYRPFCKYICPLGALYGLLNRFSLWQMNVDEQACIHCGKCEQACKMQVPVLKNINSPECIRCGLCREVCPTQAISGHFRLGPAPACAPALESPGPAKKGLENKPCERKQP